MANEPTQPKKPLYKRWWFWVLVIGVLYAIGKNSNQESSSTSVQRIPTETSETQPQRQSIPLPKKQIAFIAAIQSVKGEYEAAPNELKKSAVRTKRGKLIQQALGNSRNISDWVGILTDMQTNSDGKAIIEIQLEGTDIKVKTWNNSMSDIFDNTLIPQASRLYSAIAEMSKGQRVVFSGSFLSSDKGDYAEEASMTEAGSMSDPEFIFNFKSIRRY